MRGNCRSQRRQAERLAARSTLVAARSTLVVVAGRDTCLMSKQNDEYQRHDDDWRELLLLDLT
jgi:hypothetical protein